MTQLTREQAIETYGKVPLKFSGYYKYTFSFSGTADDGANIDISIGGNSDAIYRYNVGPSTVEVLESGYSATITKDGEEIYSHYDY